MRGTAKHAYISGSLLGKALVDIKSPDYFWGGSRIELHNRFHGQRAHVAISRIMKATRDTCSA